MTTLTDRYVWAVLRAVPAAQRPELEPEIRALIADAAEAKAAVEPSPAAAERAALTELGDPEALAGRYVDRTMSLIGPQVYPEWRRLLSLLLPVVVPIVTLVVMAANLADEQPADRIIANGLAAGIGVGIQTLFWVTLVFALLERFGTKAMPGRTWSLDQLPEAPTTARMSIADAVATIAANLFVAIGLLWVQLLPPIVLDGQAFPLFDPNLWSFWIPWFIVVTLAEVGFAIALYRHGRWTEGFAIANAILGAAFAIPAIWLLQSDLLLNPALVSHLDATGRDWFDVTLMVTTIVLIATVGWDAIDGFLKAWRNRREQVQAAIA